METKLDKRIIVAIGGVYKDILRSKSEKASEHGTLSKTLRNLRGMDAFLKKLLAVENTRFKIMPPHMLGGALILSRIVFFNLPFDPYVARGEDHAYAWDLKNHLGKNRIAIRDNYFVVAHQKAKVSKKQIGANVLRDIFRFVYSGAKTGISFIPLFIVRWGLASLIQLFLDPSEYAQCNNELLALMFFAPRFAKENASKYRQNFKTWNNLLNQSRI
jgi:hypothetical protein